MKYRKKPVVIEAVQWNNNIEEVLAFAEDTMSEESNGILYGKTLILATEEKPPRLFIRTREGLVGVEPGAYVVRDVKGGIYPCAADVFVETHEAVE